MNIAEIVLMGVALSMDAFAVTISDTFCYRGSSRARMLMLPVAFGAFQGLMPLAGYVLGGIAGPFIEAYSGIVTLVILGFIGAAMVKEGVSAMREGGDGCGCSPDAVAALTVRLVAAQAVATSIDAFAVGVSLRAAGADVAVSASIIALTTCACCLAALAIGRRFGTMLGERAQVVGGIVLILIGAKALVS